MKIVHIAREPLTGVWSVLRTLSEWQQSMGHSVTLALLVSKRWPHFQDLEGLTSKLRIFWSPAISGTAAFAFHDFSRTGDLLNTVLPEDAVRHHHNAWMSSSLFGNDPGIARVVTFHGVPVEPFLSRKPIRRRLHLDWATRVGKETTKLVSVEKTGTESAMTVFGIDSARFAVIHNGVPDCGVRGVPYLRGAREFTVGYVGALVPNKGWQLVGDAVEACRKKGLPVRLLIAGHGPESEREAAEYVCHMLGEYGTFLGLVRDAARNVVPNLDALVLPSDHEGLPVVIVEALAAGVPVVATAVGGIPEAIQDGKEGYLVARHSSAIAAAIERLILDRSTLIRIHEQARARFVSEFQMEKMGNQYLDAYDCALRLVR
jgi:glycosyltransferase involved in cell wall biosynthesis